MAISRVSGALAVVAREASDGHVCTTRSVVGGSPVTTKIGPTGRRPHHGVVPHLARQTVRCAEATFMARVMAARTEGSASGPRQGREETTRRGRAKSSSPVSHCRAKGLLQKRLADDLTCLFLEVGHAIGRPVLREVVAISVAVISSFRPTFAEIAGGRAITRMAKVRLFPTAAPSST